MDILKAVIGLGPNIFYGAGISASILIFKANKSVEEKGKVLFIDASDQIRVGRAQNYLEEKHSNQIYDWYSNFAEVQDSVHCATLDEIEKNDFSLNIPLYVEKTVEDNLPTIDEATKQLKVSMDDMWRAEDKLKDLLKEFSLME